MSKITRMGIDLGKNTFHVCAMDRAGRVVLEKSMIRTWFLASEARSFG